MADTQQAIVIGKVTMTFTPYDPAFPAFVIESDSLSGESEFLSEPSLKNPRAENFAAADGVNSTTLLNYATNGTRTLTVREGASSDKIVSLAQKNPASSFDLDVSYVRNKRTGNIERTLRHINCSFRDVGKNGLGGNGEPVVSFEFNFGQLKRIDENGAEL